MIRTRDFAVLSSDELARTCGGLSLPFLLDKLSAASAAAGRLAESHRLAKAMTEGLSGAVSAADAAHLAEMMKPVQRATRHVDVLRAGILRRFGR